MVDENELLEVLADDAFEVQNWARRLGLKKDAQREQMAAAMRKRLEERGVTFAPRPGGADG
ncbi:MAG: hypothetical protein AAFW69_04435 [Pseudomonadota bacterium]